MSSAHSEHAHDSGPVTYDNITECLDYLEKSAATRGSGDEAECYAYLRRVAECFPKIRRTSETSAG